MRDILGTIQADIKKLKRNDVVVIWGGSNDIGRNNSREALKHLCNFVEKNQKVNTVVMTAPPRYDLLPSSCVNNEVNSFNRQLKKRMAPYNNVKILETGLKREYFTKHGMHLNSSGKESIAKSLAIVVRNFLKKERMSPISLYWKDDTSVTQIEVVNKNTERLIQEINETMSENSDNKQVDDRDRQNNESVVVQNQEGGGERNSELRNNSMDPEVARASSTSTQCTSLDKVAETRRASNRNKKTPSIRGNDVFLW
jgi:hypothetical protein